MVDTRVEDTSRVDTAAVDVSNDDGPDDAEEPRACVQISAEGGFLLSYADSVSIEYETATTPTVDAVYDSLSILFERYSPEPDIGTFELGTGADADFGTCARCVYMRGATRERAYFADRGTLVSRTDPYSRRPDMTITNLRLIEVDVDGTRSSTPVPGGGCIEVAELTVQGVFPASGWTCEAEKFRDETTCDCECGAPDPDCDDRTSCFPGDPGCVPRENLPVEGCETDEICTFEPVTMGSQCVATCDWEGRSGCAEGTCVYDFGLGQGAVCETNAARLASSTGVGDPCPPSNLQLVCAIDGAGFAMGYCGPNGTCRALCESDAECTEVDHTCRRFVGFEGLGYCGPEPVDPDG